MISGNENDKSKKSKESAGDGEEWKDLSSFKKGPPIYLRPEVYVSEAHDK